MSHSGWLVRVTSPGTQLDDMLALYVFDRQCCLLVLDALEKMEVAVRVALPDHMSQAYGAFWYLGGEHFKDSRGHQGLLKIVRDECARQLLPWDR